MGPIRFGMKKKDVRTAMEALGLGPSSTSRTMDYFGDENAIQVEYEKGTASFIGIAGGRHFECSIYDVDPFDTPARELFRLLAKHDGAKGARFTKAGCLLRNSIVTLYEADTQYDRNSRSRRVIWGQVGLGDARYLAAIPMVLKPAPRVSSQMSQRRCT